ncbi:hypothetical protein P4I85_22685 [Bacillus cereus]|nr:hypothetical protein [Bacillus cereus]MEB9511376.1 hypothetical protein [Bacillus cereus]MEB9563266.1 hypothetical protein [Bacillus cereus]MRC06902.1 hypothetical protein [Bacillus thuringiensis]MRC80249.1 hypothetical protein [Bacillus thuringiensis]
MKNQFYQINTEEFENINMHLVSKFAHIIFEIKCETDISDDCCHEMENVLDDTKTIFVEINHFTLVSFVIEYKNAYKRLNNNQTKQQKSLLTPGIAKYITTKTSNLRELGHNIIIEREDLEQFILNFEYILKKLSI